MSLKINGINRVPVSDDFKNLDGPPRTGSCVSVHLLTRNIRELVEKRRLAFDWNGHFKNGKGAGSLSQFLLQMFEAEAMSRDDLHALSRSLIQRRPLDRFVKIGHTGLIGSCTCCGQELKIVTNGKVVKADSPCPLPKGIYPVSTKVNVPSGRIVVADELVSYYTVLFRGGSTQFAYAAHAGDWAKRGVAHFGLNLQDPDIYQQNGTHLTLSFPTGDRRKDSKEIKGKKIGRIDGGGWYIVDYEALRSKCGKSPKAFARLVAERGWTAVNVTPGLYNFTSYDPLNRKHEEPFNQVKIERVGPVTALSAELATASANGVPVELADDESVKKAL